MDTNSGKLFLCATPIGNLEDITLRVLRILKEVDVIAAEDTKHTKKLLNHFKINTPLTSYHRYNKEKKGRKLIEMMQKGKNIALVSDAGTPGISDPGEELVKHASSEGIAVIPVPGPSALVTALAVSGLPTKKFVFEGFLPRKAKEREKLLQELEGEGRTLVFYEAPHRVKKSLEDLRKHMGNRKICIARELTKQHEEIFRGNIEEALEKFQKNTPLGEFVFVVEGNQNPRNQKSIWNELTVKEHLLIYINRGLSKKQAIARVARERNLSKREVYDVAIDLKE